MVGKGTRRHQLEVGEVDPVFAQISQQLQQLDPLSAERHTLKGLQTALDGKLSMDFKPLQAPGSSTLGNVDLKSTYNFNPAKVASTLDNTKFTQDYFDKSVSAPLLRQYDTAIAPRLNDAASAAGNTFSTRTQVAKQMALQDLQTQMSAQLASAARQDNIERSQQQLQAQEFNVNSSMGSAQFGANLAAQLAGKTADVNTQRGQLNADTRLGYDTLNTQTQFGLAEGAANRRLSATELSNQIKASTTQQLLQKSQAALPGQQVADTLRSKQLQEAYRQMPENDPWLNMMMTFLSRDPNTVVKPDNTASYIGAGASAAVGIASLAALF